MDPITEEVITGLIRRIRIIEEKVDGKPQAQTPTTQPGVILATQGQINYLKGLGGNPWNGMTKKEATELIGKLVEKKESEETSGPEICAEDGNQSAAESITENKTTYTESDIQESDLL